MHIDETQFDYFYNAEQAATAPLLKIWFFNKINSLNNWVPVPVQAVATQTELVQTFFNATSEQSAVFAQPAHFKLVHAEAEA